MQPHKIVSHEEWIAARKAHLSDEKAFTRARDALSKKRRELPWEKVEKKYVFDGPNGKETLADLFGGKSQLIVYHFMFGPGWEAGCPVCSAVADGFDGIAVHLAHHDVTLAAVSRAPIEKLTAYRRRMGWSFPWVSSSRSDFNFDFGVSFTEDSICDGAEHNFRPLDAALLDHLPVEGHGVSAFALDEDAVFHTYSAYTRGTDVLFSMWQWLDRAPQGRNLGDLSWFHRHDEYPPD